MYCISISTTEDFSLSFVGISDCGTYLLNTGTGLDDAEVHHGQALGLFL